MNGTLESVITSKEKIMTDSPNNVQSEHISDKALRQAGLAQCAFIAIQALIFPELSYVGSIIAAQCALLPWLLPIFRKGVTTAVAMSITSIIISPIFLLVCIHAFERVTDLIGPTVSQITFYFVGILKAYLGVSNG